MLDWSPFVVLAAGERPPPPRGIHSADGVGDRLRATAFAELQAREAFLWANERWLDAPEKLREAWRRLAVEEDKHLGWLLKRMDELGVSVTERPVSLHLWDSFTACETAKQFTERMAGAEERGLRAGERFHRKLAERDPVTAEMFGQIAREEAGHVALAKRFLPLLSD